MKQGQKKLAVASAAMIGAEGALALLHTGGTGVIAGLAVAALVYLAADEVHQARGGSDQEGEQGAPEHETKGGEDAGGKQHSFMYRLVKGKGCRRHQDD